MLLQNLINRFHDLNIRKKLILTMLLLGMLPMLILMIYASFGIRNLLNSFSDIISIEEAKIMDLQFREFMMQLGMVWLLCTLTIFITTLIISQQISKPLKSLASESDRLSEKDLTSNLVNTDSFHGDEIGKLECSFHNVLKNLRSIISVVNESAHQIGSSSEELASISEEVNALSEEIGATIQQISRGASNQSDLATRAIEDTNQMAEVIDQSLQDIENTLKVIEDVAGQTNILALNAAIEAARAGEYGRGFAVVADNVRRLAEETKSNSADISRLTEQIVTNITGSVNSLQETLQGFAAQSEEFSASSEEVAAATEEQVAAMNQMTSEAQNVNKLGETLIELISQFKLQNKKQRYQLNGS